MLIISKFKDYYDSIVQTTGIDKEHIFNRKNETVEFDKNSIITYDFNYLNKIVDINKYLIEDEYYSIKPFILGFCGRYYIGWRVVFNNMKKKYIWNKDEIIEILSKQKYNYSYKFNKKIIHEFYNDFHLKEDISLFRKYNVSYFKMDIKYNVNVDYLFNCVSDEIEKHPILKDIEFYKVFDTFKCFQEIDMFLFGVLGTKENNIIKIEDKYKISKYGFDKFSFRKDKNK